MKANLILSLTLLFASICFMEPSKSETICGLEKKACEKKCQKETGKAKKACLDKCEEEDTKCENLVS